MLEWHIITRGDYLSSSGFSLSSHSSFPPLSPGLSSSTQFRLGAARGITVEKKAWRPVPVPYMILTVDNSQGCDSNYEPMRWVYLHTKGSGAYFFSVTGTRHFNFVDLPFRKQIALRPAYALVGLDGSIPPARGMQIANAYLTTFWGHFLKQMPEVILQGSIKPTQKELSRSIKFWRGKWYRQPKD